MIRQRRTVDPVPPITAADIRANSIIDTTDDDPLIEEMILAAMDLIERQCDRAFGPQTWEAFLDAFPATAIEDLHEPVTAIESINYLPADGSPEIALDASGYVLGTLTNRIVPVSDWPATATHADAVRIVYEAGDGWSPSLIRAIKLLVGQWYENREAWGQGISEVPHGVSAIISAHRRPSA